MSFGQRLTQVRKSKKLSQEELGAKEGAVGAIVGRYERDAVKPSVEMAAALASAFDVSLDYLAGNTDLMIDKTLLKRMSHPKTIRRRKR